MIVDNTDFPDSQMLGPVTSVMCSWAKACREDDCKARLRGKDIYLQVRRKETQVVGCTKGSQWRCRRQLSLQ